MKTAGLTIRPRRYGILLSVILIVLFFSKSPAHALTVDEYITQGRGQLLEQTVSGVLAAHATFQEAQTAYPGNETINVLLACTRFLDLAFRNDGGNTDTVAELLGLYGIYFSGNSLEMLNLVIPEDDDGNLVLPVTAPSGETVRAFLAGPFLDAINASLNNLASVTTQSFKIILPASELYTDSVAGDLDVEIDYGDILFLRAMLEGLRSLVLTISAYDFNVDVRLAFSLQGNLKLLMDRYQDFLNLLPTATTSGNGAAQLAEAENALAAAINTYLAASEHIRNDIDTEPGAEELITIDFEELSEEQRFRVNLAELQSSLQENRVADLIDSTEPDGGDHTRVNLNYFFGDGSTALNLRDLLPELDPCDPCWSEPIPGTMGHGIGDDPTLGGILVSYDEDGVETSFTQDFWTREMDLQPCGVVIIPERTINVQDGSLGDWSGIDPVFTDITDDHRLRDFSGADIRYLYLARDSEFLYVRMTLADGPPNTSCENGASMHYFVKFRRHWDYDLSERYNGVKYDPSGDWQVMVHQYSGWVVHGDHPTGYAQAVGNDLEWKVPLDEAGPVNGRFITTWTHWTPSYHCPGDYNDTGLLIGPVATISGTLTCDNFNPNRGAPIYLDVSRDDQTLLGDEERLISYSVIFSEDFTNNMTYSIANVPVGLDVFAGGHWDANFDGPFTHTPGEVRGGSASFSVASSGNTVNLVLDDVIISSGTADGDIAPWQDRDGGLNIGDAVVALRCSIGALIPTADDIAHGDVAPLQEVSAGVYQPNPDGQIAIGDAVVILRAVVGLVTWEGMSPVQ